MNELESLIEKTNLIEKNFGVVERHFYLGGKHWFVGKAEIYILDYDNIFQRIVTDEELQEFLIAKKDFDAMMI